MPAVRRKARLIRVLIRPVALGAFAFWVLWNGAWLTSGHVPPSILTAFTGIPSPTTGGTRSLLAAVDGRWVDSVLWNPLTFVYLSMAVGSGIFLARQALTGKRISLSGGMARTWVFVLATGWLMKLVIGPRSW